MCARRALKLFAGTAAFSRATACRFFRQNALNVSRAVAGPGEGRKGGYVAENVWKPSPLHNIIIFPKATLIK
jgi:hypothetical protein